MLNDVQQSILSLLQDSTRLKILKILSQYSVHPDILVQETGVSRTAVEKHLKQLLSTGILERRAQTYPRLRYIYSLTAEAEVLINTISVATEQYAESVVERWEEELLNIEQGFVFGVLQKEEFTKLKSDFSDRIGKLKFPEESNED